jgi:hypothetical protein
MGRSLWDRPGLAGELHVTLQPGELDAMINDANLAGLVSLATDAGELLRRSEDASQGTGVLALWHEIDWPRRKTDSKIQQSVNRIQNAEKTLIARLEHCGR